MCDAIGAPIGDTITHDVRAIAEEIIELCELPEPLSATYDERDLRRYIAAQVRRAQRSGDSSASIDAICMAVDDELLPRYCPRCGAMVTGEIGD